MKQLTVLSGSGSPHSEEYAPVYNLLESECMKRGYLYKLIDYVGIGQYPEIGDGLSLPASIEKARNEINANDGSTLLCRSFGCFIAGYFLDEEPELLECYDRIIFWGPSSLHGLWEHIAKDKNSLKKLNDKAINKGCKFHDTFWLTISPIEYFAKNFNPKAISIGYGTEDIYCDKAFASYFQALILNYTDCTVDITEIEGAKHEIKNSDTKKVLNQYFSFIFQ